MRGRRIKFISLERLPLQVSGRPGEGRAVVRHAVEVDLVGVLLERVLQVLHRLLPVGGGGTPNTR